MAVSYSKGQGMSSLIPPLPPTPTNEIYGTLVSGVNEGMLQKLMNVIAIAASNKVDRIHLLMHSTGGFVNDGIAGYNFLRTLPLDVILYNVGSIQSIASVMFLGANKRKASKAATFMIHRSHFSSPIPASSAQLHAVAQSLALDDSRMEEILRSHITMPADKWEIHKHADLFLTAQDALSYGIIDEIADFAPPLGATLFNVVS